MRLLGKVTKLLFLCVQREDAVDNFRAGKTWVLIATDVIARGMDFKGINCVINYDFPESAAAYIHRIGMLIGCLSYVRQTYYCVLLQYFNMKILP